jgi:hypothetical protein
MFATLTEAINYHILQGKCDPETICLAELMRFAMEGGDRPKFLGEEDMTLMDVLGIYESLWEHSKKPLRKEPLMKSMRELYGGRLSAPVVLRMVMEPAMMDHKSQRSFIQSVMRIQNNGDWGKGQCPVKVADIPGKGRGLVAKRDIKEGELVGIYPVDWVIYGDQHQEWIKKQPRERPDMKMPFEDQHTWSMYNGLLGEGDLYNKENFNMMEQSIRDNEGVITKELETYGYTCLGQEAEDSEKWRGYDDVTSETWAHPKINHPNEWAVIHMGNDGLYTPGMTKDDYAELNKGCKTDGPVNINLDFICIAVRDIKAGEEIQDSYGENYWFNGIVTKDMDACLDRKNKGRVKKFKAKYKKHDETRKGLWKKLHDAILRSYDPEQDIHQLYEEDRLSFHIFVNDDGKTSLGQMLRTQD